MQKILDTAVLLLLNIVFGIGLLVTFLCLNSKKKISGRVEDEN